MANNNGNSNGNSTIDVIITRYNEFINWIDYLPENIRNIYVYNKGYNNNFFKNHVTKYSEKLIITNIRNVGKIEQTICYHIINNTQSLADTNVFLPGSILMNPQKGKYLGNIIKNIKNIDKYSGFYSPKFKKVNKNYNYVIKEKNINENSRNINNSEVTKSEYTSLLDFKNQLINDKPLKYISFRSQFIVSKENILKVPLSLFKDIEKVVSVGENCDSCYYLERLWAHLFKI